MQRRALGTVFFLIEVALGFGLLAPPAKAQAPVPLGAQFQVNSYTTSTQSHPDVAADADGNFVVVWASSGSFGTDLFSSSIQGQRYDSGGSPGGAEFQVNTYTTSSQGDGSVALDADGDFVVVWTSRGSFGTDSSSLSIQGQRYSSSGATQGGQFQVNSYTISDQFFPDVAADADGDFVVVWQSQGSFGTDAGHSVQGQRYASNGAALGTQFQVNTYTTENQGSASVTADSDGDFVVVWENYYYSIRGQRYSSSGAAQGAEFEVSSTLYYQTNPSVAASSDGSFVVVWDSFGSVGSDSSLSSVQGQRYSSTGSAAGAQFQVNTITSGGQSNPAVSADADGDFAVTWSGFDGDFGGIHGQRFASNGASQGTEFQVNTYTTDRQYTSFVAASAAGDFIVVWDSRGSPGTDSSLLSIQAQRYRQFFLASALSPATRVALGAALLALGAGFALRRRAAR